MERQTGSDVSPSQVVFDVVAGACLPLFLLWLDRAWDPMGTGGGLAPFQPYTGALAGVGALAVGAFHVVRRAAPALLPVVGGTLLATGGGALAVTSLLLPLSLIGVLVRGIGLLGLLPFLTVFAQLRCAARASRARGAPRRGIVSLLMTAGVCAALAAGAAIGRTAKIVARHEERVLLGERTGDEDAAVMRLAVLWRWPGVTLRLLRTEAMGADAVELRRIEGLWVRITGDVGPPDAD